MRQNPELRPSAGIECTESFRARPDATHALFDFDGTLSLVRAGWAEVMLTMFLELAPNPPDHSPASWRRLMVDDIRRNNGKPTIHQMERFVERASPSKSAQWHLEEFLRRLMAVSNGRIAAVRSGAVPAVTLAVPGAERILDALTKRGLVLHLASGTDERSVRSEADLLGLTRFFGDRIYAPRGDSDGFSKRAAIERIVAEAGGDGSRLLSFGDGPIEISETKRVGGLAVAVASDETGKHPGRIDADKRTLLLEMGADAVIPDFSNLDGLLATLIGAPGSDPAKERKR